MELHKFSVRERLLSFRYAFNGIKTMFRSEHNSRIHFAVALLVILAGILFRVTALEWIALIFAIGLVFSLELVNSSIETLADFVSPGKHQLVKKAKDLSAAAVLIGSLTAVAIGLIIFVPRLF